MSSSGVALFFLEKLGRLHTPSIAMLRILGKYPKDYDSPMNIRATATFPRRDGADWRLAGAHADHWCPERRCRGARNLAGRCKWAPASSRRTMVRLSMEAIAHHWLRYLPRRECSLCRISTRREDLEAWCRNFPYDANSPGMVAKTVSQACAGDRAAADGGRVQGCAGGVIHFDRASACRSALTRRSQTGQTKPVWEPTPWPDRSMHRKSTASSRLRC